MLASLCAHLVGLHLFDLVLQSLLLCSEGSDLEMLVGLLLVNLLQVALELLDPASVVADFLAHAALVVVKLVHGLAAHLDVSLHVLEPSFVEVELFH